MGFLAPCSGRYRVSRETDCGNAASKLLLVWSRERWLEHRGFPLPAYPQGGHRGRRSEWAESRTRQSQTDQHQDRPAVHGQPPPECGLVLSTRRQRGECRELAEWNQWAVQAAACGLDDEFYFDVVFNAPERGPLRNQQRQNRGTSSLVQPQYRNQVN